MRPAGLPLRGVLCHQRCGGDVDILHGKLHPPSDVFRFGTGGPPAAMPHLTELNWLLMPFERAVIMTDAAADLAAKFCFR